jgi:hypothetical protein
MLTRQVKSLKFRLEVVTVDEAMVVVAVKLGIVPVVVT